jgi:GntR family transcriptional regulator
MIVADAQATPGGADTRADLLRPTLERAALEARQLELDDEAVLALFARVLQAQRKA